jgi:hypothetical protein
MYNSLYCSLLVCIILSAVGPKEKQESIDLQYNPAVFNTLTALNAHLANHSSFSFSPSFNELFNAAARPCIQVHSFFTLLSAATLCTQGIRFIQNKPINIQLIRTTSLNTSFGLLLLCCAYTE